MGLASCSKCNRRETGKSHGPPKLCTTYRASTLFSRERRTTASTTCRCDSRGHLHQGRRPSCQSSPRCGRVRMPGLRQNPGICRSLRTPKHSPPQRVPCMPAPYAHQLQRLARRVTLMCRHTLQSIQRTWYWRRTHGFAGTMRRVTDTKNARVPWLQGTL